MTLRPNSELVGRGWLALALPDVATGARLPDDAAMPDLGFVRTSIVGGALDPYLPMRAPVLGAECWVPPEPGKDTLRWGRAAQLAERIVAATFDPALMGVELDLSGFGDYAPALVRTVIALNEPRRVEDPSKLARFDIDLNVFWTTT